MPLHLSADKLMEAVGQRIRSAGQWLSADDEPSRSADRMPRGLARIDWALSDLKDEGRLPNPQRDVWRLPSSQDLLQLVKSPPPRPPANATGVIVKDPHICGGEPVIRGTRVTLRTILASLADGDDIPDILRAFPTLTDDDIRGVIAFAASAAHDDLPVPGVPV